MGRSDRAVVVVGASAAGLRCACRLARLKPGWHVGAGSPPPELLLLLLELPPSELLPDGLDGAEPVNLTADMDYSASGVRWAPDGSRIYFTAAQGRTTLLYAVRPTGGPARMVLPDNEFVYSVQDLS